MKKMLECFDCGCVSFLGEKKCLSCGGNRFFEVKVDKQEYNFHKNVEAAFSEIEWGA